MRTVTEKGYAKLNLTLDLLGVKEGYHTLDSLVTTVDLFDTVTLTARKDGQVKIAMHGMGCENIPDEKNNAVRAAHAFMEAYHTTGVDITVYKNIPVGAGMGGSSADVAAVLNGMARLYRVRDDEGLKALADRLGSDTGYLLTGGLARMQGRGERVQFYKNCPKLYFLLFLPNSGVSTAAAYAKSDELQKSEPRTEEVLSYLLGGNIPLAAQGFSNGLYRAASVLNEDVKQALSEARAFSPLGAAMTGSGSCVFACFDSVELCAWAQSRYKGKFTTQIVRAIKPKKSGGFWRNPFAL